MEKVYTGELSVIDGDEIKVERLIVRDQSIAFSFSGWEQDYGDYHTDGEATMTEHGFYFVSKIPLRYKKYLKQDQLDVVSIKFTSIEPTPKGKVCKVVGEWIQDGETWLFEGSLEERKL